MRRAMARPICRLQAFARIGFDGDVMTGHGFRHTASTLLNELGHDENVVERQLAHVREGMKGVYNHAEFLEKRREMMQVWADHLDSLKHGNKNEGSA